MSIGLGKRDEIVGGTTHDDNDEAKKTLTMIVICVTQ